MVLLFRRERLAILYFFVLEGCLDQSNDTDTRPLLGLHGQRELGMEFFGQAHPILDERRSVSVNTSSHFTRAN